MLSGQHKHKCFTGSESNLVFVTERQHVLGNKALENCVLSLILLVSVCVNLDNSLLFLYIACLSSLLRIWSLLGQHCHFLCISKTLSTVEPWSFLWHLGTCLTQTLASCIWILILSSRGLATSPRFISPANLVRICSFPSPKSFTKILNAPGPRTNSCESPLDSFSLRVTLCKIHFGYGISIRSFF